MAGPALTVPALQASVAAAHPDHQVSVRLRCPGLEKNAAYTQSSCGYRPAHEKLHIARSARPILTVPRSGWGAAMSDRQRTCIVAATLLWCCLGIGEAAATIPVLEATPACAYGKLGPVTAEAGTRITESSMDKAPPQASYARAFDRLAAAAQAVGANAVVLRGHRATYFTRFGKRSREAVHIYLSGAAIHIEGDTAQCKLTVVDPRDYRRANANLRLVETTSDQAYDAD
ncbi:hypothetical protein ACFQ0H_23825 [Lysobacter gummosus]